MIVIDTCGWLERLERGQARMSLFCHKNPIFRQLRVGEDAWSMEHGVQSIAPCALRPAFYSSVLFYDWKEHQYKYIKQEY